MFEKMFGKNGCVDIGNTQMYYVSFGAGAKKLVVLPGLSDGLATVKGKAILLSAPYRKFMHEYTVYMFSRRDALPPGFTVRDIFIAGEIGVKGLVLHLCFLSLSFYLNR